MWEAYLTAQRRWMGIHVAFEAFSQRMEEAEIPIERIATDDLYLAIALGNQFHRAMDIFYRLYGNYIKKISLRIVSKPDIAEDILQDFIYELPEKIKKYRGTGSLYGWLGMVIPNFSRNYLRKIKDYTPLDKVSDPMVYDPQEHIDFAYCKKLFGKILPEAMKELKKEWRLIIQCKFFDGLTNREIANTVLQTPEYNVSKWLKQALKKMEKHLLKLAAKESPADGKNNIYKCLEVFDALK